MFVEVSTRLEYGLIYFPIFTVLKTDKIMTKAAIVNEIFLKMGTDRKEYIENGIAAHCTFHINSLMMCEESKENKKKIMMSDKR